MQENDFKVKDDSIINIDAEERIEKFEKLKKRLSLINYYIETKTNPKWMTVKYLPVLPPNLRPVVKLQDKTIIITELNFLYSKIINSNNKLIILKKMRVPETFLTKEINLLKENVGNLLGNQKVKSNSKRLLKY